VIEGLRQACLWILTHPQLERFRARVPYPLVVGLLTLFTVLVFVIFHALLETLFSGGRVALFDSVAADPLLVVGPVAAMGLFLLTASLTGIGWLSGYRPFIHRWTLLDTQCGAMLFDSLVAVAAELGFGVVWQRSGESFVAVSKLDLERKRTLNPGTDFPMRLVVRIDARDPGALKARMTLGLRTICVWDTGETKTCRDIGQAIVRQVAGVWERGEASCGSSSAVDSADQLPLAGVSQERP
jgi:hypothetical protein